MSESLRRSAVACDITPATLSVPDVSASPSPDYTDAVERVRLMNAQSILTIN